MKKLLALFLLLTPLFAFAQFNPNQPYATVNNACGFNGFLQSGTYYSNAGVALAGLPACTPSTSGSSAWSSLTAPTANNSVTATADTSQTLLGHFDTSVGSGVALFALGEDVASTKIGGTNVRSRILSISTLASSTAYPLTVSVDGSATLNFWIDNLGVLRYAGPTDAVTGSGGSGVNFAGGSSASANAAGSVSLTGGANSSTGAGGNITLTPGTSTSGQAGLLVSAGLEASTAKTVVATNSLTSQTISTRYTYLTGTAGASMALTFPAGASAIDGELITIMSTTSRTSTTCASTGASFVGCPSTMAVNTPYKFQYDNGSTTWYITN